MGEVSDTTAAQPATSRSYETACGRDGCNGTVMQGSVCQVCGN